MAQQLPRVVAKLSLSFGSRWRILHRVYLCVATYRLNQMFLETAVFFPVNKTKLVCTIGPASGRPEVLQEMLRAGMNVAETNWG